MSEVREFGGAVAALGAVCLVAAAVAAAANGGTIPSFWPYPAAVLGSFALAYGVHTVVTGRFQSTSVVTTAAVVFAAMLLTTPVLDYAPGSASLPYFLVGITVLPAALGAAAKRANRRLVLVLAAAVVGLGVVAGSQNTSWSVPSFVAIDLAVSAPGALVGWRFTAAA